MVKNFKDKFYRVFRPNKARRRAEERAAREAQAQAIAYDPELAVRVSEAMIDTRLPENTLIIFDWDDTLFPTFEYGTQDTNCWDAEIIASFSRIERAGMNLLLLASTMGVVKIVTQASICWYRGTGRGYMPDLYDLITELNIEVISARENHEDSPEVDFDDYKTREFYSLVHSMIWNAGKDPRDDSALPVSVVSIGDGMHEYLGAQRLNSLIPVDQIKIVKFEEDPTLETLALQLVRIHDTLDEVVDSREHFCVDYAEINRDED